MAAIAATLHENQTGPTPAEQGMVSEFVDIAGTASVGGESVAYTPTFVGKPVYNKGGGFSYTVSGGVITIKAEHALGNDTETIEVTGYVS